MIKLASPDIKDADLKKVIDVLKSGDLVQGVNVAGFEMDLSVFAGLPYCSVVTSGTAALHLALLALNLPKNSGVIVPAFTFPATANVVENTGGQTIFCEVDPQTYIVTPELIERTILANKDKNLKAIIVVHEFGQPVQMKKMAKITEKYGLKLIEDAACALGTTVDDHHVGYYSDMACFSFHPRKAITTGEGGAIMTRQKELDLKIKKLRNHGMEKINGQIDFIYAGLNYRLNEFQAVLGREQLKRFNKELIKRQKLAEIYTETLKDENKIILPQNLLGNSWQSYMVVLKESVKREKVIENMERAGVQVNLGAQALNCLSYFQKKYHCKTEDFPIASRLFRQGLVLPLYGKLTAKDIIYISNQLKKALYE